MCPGAGFHQRAGKASYPALWVWNPGFHSGSVIDCCRSDQNGSPRVECYTPTGIKLVPLKIGSSSWLFNTIVKPGWGGKLGNQATLNGVRYVRVVLAGAGFPYG